MANAFIQHTNKGEHTGKHLALSGVVLVNLARIIVDVLQPGNGLLVREALVLLEDVVLVLLVLDEAELALVVQL